MGTQTEDQHAAAPPPTKAQESGLAEFVSKCVGGKCTAATC